MNTTEKESIEFLGYKQHKGETVALFRDRCFTGEGKEYFMHNKEECEQKVLVFQKSGCLCEEIKAAPAHWPKENDIT